MNVFYAVRHRPTGGLLPARTSQARMNGPRGYTNDEPSTTLPPRLHATAGAARRALKWWLKGPLHREIIRTGSWDGVDDYERVVAGKHNRAADDMDIVEVLVFTRNRV